ncbi:hypothetical protein BpHYR1_048315 [Brachionus plicatilis]|uniref:Uncharacterized protein n=1 Tax=Brachionus plicatilis TaxID=10195 RepID=A0A3M7QN27_BRAPC|nr:hypothetical protein BpHYR1_048315 [Brachionus plicatilis]
MPFWILIIEFLVRAMCLFYYILIIVTVFLKRQNLNSAKTHIQIFNMTNIFSPFLAKFENFP